MAIDQDVVDRFGPLEGRVEEIDDVLAAQVVQNAAQDRLLAELGGRVAAVEAALTEPEPELPVPEPPTPAPEPVATLDVQVDGAEVTAQLTGIDVGHHAPATVTRVDWTVDSVDVRAAVPDLNPPYTLQPNNDPVTLTNGVHTIEATVRLSDGDWWSQAAVVDVNVTAPPAPVPPPPAPPGALTARRIAEAYIADGQGGLSALGVGQLTAPTRRVGSEHRLAAGEVLDISGAHFDYGIRSYNGVEATVAGTDARVTSHEWAAIWGWGGPVHVDLGNVTFDRPQPRKSRGGNGQLEGCVGDLYRCLIRDNCDGIKPGPGGPLNLVECFIGALAVDPDWLHNDCLQPSGDTVVNLLRCVLCNDGVGTNGFAFAKSADGASMLLEARDCVLLSDNYIIKNYSWAKWTLINCVVDYPRNAGWPGTVTDNRYGLAAGGGPVELIGCTRWDGTPWPDQVISGLPQP